MLLVGLPAAPAHAATYIKVVRYGPFTIPAGTDTSPGQPVPAGRHLRWHLAGPGRERFFASGDERTAISFPYGYGYRVRWYDSWNMLVDLMNHSTTQKTVYVLVTYTYGPSWEPVRRVKPVWLDIDQSGDSEYSIPAGCSDTYWDWRVNVPGRVVAMFGHVHGHGIAVEATNESRGGALVCQSNATLDPTDSHRVLAMSICTGDPLAVIGLGETVGLHSMYQSSHPADDVMGFSCCRASRVGAPCLTWPTASATHRHA